MNERIDTADKILECCSCGDGFVFTSGEQELFRLRGIAIEPARCPKCVRGRVLAEQGLRGAETRR
jgi:hypothetical protein